MSRAYENALQIHTHIHVDYFMAQTGCGGINQIAIDRFIKLIEIHIMNLIESPFFYST